MNVKQYNTVFHDRMDGNDRLTFTRRFFKWIVQKGSSLIKSSLNYCISIRSVSELTPDLLTELQVIIIRGQALKVL